MTEEEHATYVWWRDYLRGVYIKGAMPMSFACLNDVHPFVRMYMQVPNVHVDEMIEVSRDVNMPPFIPDTRWALNKIKEWAMFMYAHELREQLYVCGQRVDIPHEDH